MLGGRRSSGADRSEAQLPAAQRTRKAEAVSKRNGPAIFAQAGPFFISSKLRRTANQVTALQAVARPTQPKLRATDSRYCGSLTRSPAGSGLYSGNSVRRFPGSIFGHGRSTKGTPGDLSTEFFVIPGMAVGTLHPLRGLFRGREPAGPERVPAAFVDSRRGPKSLAPQFAR
jgi:hypothetical protein